MIIAPLWGALFTWQPGYSFKLILESAESPLISR